MKKIVLLCLALCVICYCNAQIDWKRYSDSLALESREKADVVLSEFDSIPGKKMLFSIRDKDYYVIIHTEDHYKEFYIMTDSSHVVICKEVGNDQKLDSKINVLQSKCLLTKNKRRQLNRLQENKKIINSAFTINQYREELISYMLDADVMEGPPSYFVLKDESDKRLGEYCLSIMTFPLPIDAALWAYLTRELLNCIDFRERTDYRNPF